ncbi:MAG: hypothetical protein RLY14_2888 [Planctomycetota bacterium]|jgi:hypothetical protein
MMLKSSEAIFRFEAFSLSNVRPLRIVPASAPDMIIGILGLLWGVHWLLASMIHELSSTVLSTYCIVSKLPAKYPCCRTQKQVSDANSLSGQLWDLLQGPFIEFVVRHLSPNPRWENWVGWEYKEGT